MKNNSKTNAVKDPSFEKAIQLIRLSSSGLMEVSEAQINKAFKKVESLDWADPSELALLKSSLTRRVKRSQSMFQKQVKTAVSEAVKRVDALSQKELSKMEKTVNRLEKKIVKMANV